MGLRASVRGPTSQDFSDFRRFNIQRIERAALIATDRATRQAHSQLRGDMASSGLGRLGNAIGSDSDLRRGTGVHRRGGNVVAFHHNRFGQC